MSGRDGGDSGECGGYTGCEGVHLDARRTCTARAQVIARALILLPHDSDKTPGSIGGKTGLSTGGMRLCVTRRLKADARSGRPREIDNGGHALVVDLTRQRTADLLRGKESTEPVVCRQGRDLSDIDPMTEKLVADTPAFPSLCDAS